MVTLLCNPSRQKTPENITQILNDSALRLVWTISEYDVPKPVTVNSDQTGVQYSASGLETWAPIGDKQVEVIGKDEHRSFTLMVGISMSGEVLPFQVIYAGKSVLSLPSHMLPTMLRQQKSWGSALNLLEMIHTGQP